MKKFNQKMMLMMAVCLMTLGFSACSSKDSDKFVEETLATYASKDNVLVIRMNYWEVAENAGFTRGDNKLNIPTDIENIINRASQREQPAIRAVVSSQGVDPDAFIFILDNEELAGVFMQVTDNGEFDSTLSSLEFTQGADVEGYKVYSQHNSYILVKDGVACSAPGSTPQQVITSLNNLKAKASAAPLTAWQKDFLDDDDAFLMIGKLGDLMRMSSGDNYHISAQMRAQAAAFGIDIDQVLNGYVKVKGDLDDQEAELEFCTVNAEGATIRSSFGGETIDTSMLKYANANDMFVMMAGFSGDIDFKEMMTQAVQESLNAQGFQLSEEQIQMTNGITAKMGDLMNTVDGTMILSFGVDGNTIMSNSPSIHAVLAAQIKPGSEATIINTLADLLNESHVSFTRDGNSLNIGMDGVQVTARFNGNEFAMGIDVNTNGGCLIPESTFNGEKSALAIRIPKTFPMLSFAGINYGIDFSVVSNSERGKAELEINDTDMNLLTAVIKLFESASRFM